MPIEILPARLANQIAAGEVVERPASVIKELVENSLDAGATKIQIEVEKGGAKRIKIIDNGCGISKDELTLALSRHATSKIKDLNDLEAISSLGFRGEALASISSVARLTLTSKPEQQEAAWQACAEGRDMEVAVQPAAHPNGTSIDVKDLFFNTPARRKFLRTEKTEFGHIEEVVKRIALARFDVSFTLVHNGKVVRQYRAAKEQTQYAKRVMQVCGKSFVEQALEVNCQHDGVQLWGWIAKPEFYRSQNDLCYSYVNGRMMRDKLINHAIRQSYEDLLPTDGYPAFVLFLSLDYRDVDVNVHPAKHEVRFHQGRYIHDFIYSVCHQALQNNMSLEFDSVNQINEQTPVYAQFEEVANQAPIERQYKTTNTDYIKPLQYTDKSSDRAAGFTSYQSKQQVNTSKAKAYQELMTPYQATDAISEDISVGANINTSEACKMLAIYQEQYGLIEINRHIRLLSLSKLSKLTVQKSIAEQADHGIKSQPLLLPVKIQCDLEKMNFLNQYQSQLEKYGFVSKAVNSNSVQIREFPAMLRHQDISASFNKLIAGLMEQKSLTEETWQGEIADLAKQVSFELNSANLLVVQAEKLLDLQFEEQILLNSTEVDLTSAITALT